MFDGDNDGSSGMLPWVCVFGGLQRNIESVKMKEKKMKIKIKIKVRDVGDEWEEDEEKS